MYFSHRFYYPTLPAIIYLAAKSGVFLVDKIRATLKQINLQLPILLAPLAMLCLLGPLSSSIYILYDEMSIDFPGKKIGNFAQLDLMRLYRIWYKADKFSGLPDDLVIAATEVGLLSALNPNKKIIDMTGLNETTFAHRGFSPELLFHKYQPALIYMPHPNYEKMTEQIIMNSYFNRHYEFFPAGKLGSTLGIALCRDSKYYSAMRNIIYGG
jgi:hypothetical protein